MQKRKIRDVMDDLIFMISQKDIDKELFKELILNDEHARFILVNSLLTKKDIMIYYNSYLIIAEAVKEKPEQFYFYWNDFTALFNSKISYHHNIALSLLSYLTKADKDDKFKKIEKIFYSHLTHKSFVTRMVCVQSLINVIKNKPLSANKIIRKLMMVTDDTGARRQALLEAYVIEAIDAGFNLVKDKKNVIQFVLKCVESISPKARKAAKAFLKKHGIDYRQIKKQKLNR